MTAGGRALQTGRLQPPQERELRTLWGAKAPRLHLRCSESCLLSLVLGPVLTPPLSEKTSPLCCVGGGFKNAEKQTAALAEAELKRSAVLWDVCVTSDPCRSSLRPRGTPAQTTTTTTAAGCSSSHQSSTPTQSSCSFVSILPKRGNNRPPQRAGGPARPRWA